MKKFIFFGHIEFLKYFTRWNVMGSAGRNYWRGVLR